MPCQRQPHAAGAMTMVSLDALCSDNENLQVTIVYQQMQTVG